MARGARKTLSGMQRWSLGVIVGWKGIGTKILVGWSSGKGVVVGSKGGRKGDLWALIEKRTLVIKGRG